VTAPKTLTRSCLFGIWDLPGVWRMSRKRSKKKRLQQHRFAIKLMRPIFQTTVIVVAAATEAHAVRLALRAAARLKKEE
jgi:hypothetical protein